MNLDAVIKASAQSVTSKVKNTAARDRILSFIGTKDHAFFGKLTYIHGMLFAVEQKRTEQFIEDLHKLAAAVELYALSFDIFDDLEDQDNFTEPWMQIPSGEALNLSTLIYTISLQMLTEADRSGSLVSLVNNYSINAMIGQHEDLTFYAATEEACLEMTKRKSGSLIAMASMTGVMYSTQHFEPIVEEYATQFGVAAQIDNDYRDLFHTHKSDLAAKKNTLALLYIKREFNDASKELLQFIENGNSIEQQFGSLKAYKEVLHKTGVIHYLNVMKQIAVQKALANLNRLPFPADQIEIIKSHLIK
ncbi:polyprenyl synthetase family protein [Bacillus sp. SJS]|uniref:polyprenyl synthetase family protein n=1 Tax=Bacillus sp. SJS TaxID=1423321 RepID=UPI0006915763|nr:polyprenyl synthetase family protein [Bacillus sp. SJS]KZZ83390.1 hypothetical protein AS29_016705 [Bacillus sp. SJS]